jgi:uncharacterized membrane protein (DUF2068 family)
MGRQELPQLKNLLFVPRTNRTQTPEISVSVASSNAALFLTEGVGLWLAKCWAEWFTAIITASLVPLEIFEVHRHPTITKVIVLLLNIAIVVYLVVRIRREQTSVIDR